MENMICSNNGDTNTIYITIVKIVVIYTTMYCYYLYD